MSVFAGPNIVKTGLVLAYDPLNTRSYPGTGTDLFDLSGNSFTGTTSGSPTISAGAITTNGSNNYFRTPDIKSKFSANDVTVSIWVNTASDNGVVVAELGTTTPNNFWHDSQIEIVSGNLKVSVWNGSGVYSLTIGAVTRNVWQNYVMTYKSSNTTLTGYINASTSNSTTGSRSAPYNNSTGYYYAMGTADSTSLGDGTSLSASFGFLKVYNTALSQEDVTRNFQALRGRYGI